MTSRRASIPLGERVASLETSQDEGFRRVLEAIGELKQEFKAHLAWRAGIDNRHAKENGVKKGHADTWHDVKVSVLVSGAMISGAASCAALLHTLGLI